MGTWWSGTWLVFQRGLLENLRSRTFKVVTSLLLLAAAAAVTLPQLLGGGSTTYTLATVGRAPADVISTLQAAGRAGDFDVRFVARDSEAALRSAVRSGDATVGLGAGTLYAAATDAGTFPAIVTQTVVGLETTRRLTAAGLSDAQITALQSIRPPRHVSVAAVADEGRASVGFGVGIALYLALLFAGSAIASNVALEKTTRISEVLLAALRPSQVLVGTVLAVGTVSLAQLMVLGAPLAVAARLKEDLGLPPVATGDIALGLGWFVLGFLLYAFLYAACGALVQKVTEVSAAVMPIVLVMLAGYMLSIMVIMEDPSSAGSTALSMFPFTAPIGMPFRWAGEQVPVYQLVTAMALTALTAVALAALASRIYRRALLITDRRVHVRDVLGGGGHEAVRGAVSLRH